MKGLIFFGISDNTLHTFACDCAERALLRGSFSNRKPHQDSWDAIRVKRLWLKGKVGEDILLAANKAANSVAEEARTSTWGSSGWVPEEFYLAADVAWAAQTASSMLGSRSNAVSLAYGTSLWAISARGDDDEASEAEEIWQAQHLKSLQRKLSLDTALAQVRELLLSRFTLNNWGKIRALQHCVGDDASLFTEYVKEHLSNPYRALISALPASEWYQI